MKWSDFISFAGDAGRIPCLTPSTTSFSFLVFIAFWGEILTFSCPISIIISSWPMWFPWEMKSWSTRFGLGNLLAPSMLCNQCIEFTCNEQWFTLFGCLWSSGLLCFWFIRVYQLTFLWRSSVSKYCSWSDWFPDFPRLLSCHDSTDHPLPTDFSLGRFSKHRALILLRTRLSSGEFWEFEEIIWWDYKKLRILFQYRVLFLLRFSLNSYPLRRWRWYTPTYSGQWKYYNSLEVNGTTKVRQKNLTLGYSFFSSSIHFHEMACHLST